MRIYNNWAWCSGDAPGPAIAMHIGSWLWGAIGFFVVCFSLTLGGAPLAVPLIGAAGVIAGLSSVATLRGNVGTSSEFGESVAGFANEYRRLNPNVRNEFPIKPREMIEFSNAERATLAKKMASLSRAYEENALALSSPRAQALIHNIEDRINAVDDHTASLKEKR